MDSRIRTHRDESMVSTPRSAPIHIVFRPARKVNVGLQGKMGSVHRCSPSHPEETYVPIGEVSVGCRQMVTVIVADKARSGLVVARALVGVIWQPVGILLAVSPN